MGIFNKHKLDEFNELHNDNIFNDDDDILLPSNNSHRVTQRSAVAPHALTVDEVSNVKPEEIPMTAHPQPDSVYKRMKEREVATDIIADDYKPSWATENDKTTETIDEIISNKAAITGEIPAEPTKVAEPTAKTDTPEFTASNDAFLEKCRIAVEKVSSKTVKDSFEPDSEVPEIKTETIAEPISTPHTEDTRNQRTPDELIRMLKGEPRDSIKQDLSQAPEAAEGEQTVAFSDNNNDDDSQEIKVRVEVIPTDSASDIMHTVSKNGNTSDSDGDVRIYGKIVRGEVIQQTVDGEVQSSEFLRGPKATSNTIIAEDKTMLFGDLDSIISQRADDDAKANNFLNDEDEFDGEDYYERSYYETEDLKLQKIDDYKSLNDAARLRTAYTEEKLKNKNVAFFTLGIVALLLITATGIIGFLPNSSVALIDIILLCAALILNIDIFKDLKNLKTLIVTFDSCVAVSASLTLLQNILSVAFFDGKFCGYAAVTAVLLCVNRFAKLMKASRILKGLEFIATSEAKRAVVSVSGKNANVISSGATDDALALCDRETINIQNYIKNCSYASPFDLKAKILLISTVSVTAVIGIIVGFINGFGTGLSVVTALLSLLFPAAAALVCELPMYLACKKVDNYGGMLAGYKGAYELNLANIVAVSSSDLFPQGSVKLYNMKTLSENEIGHTIMKAAAVAIKANSPLSSIFTEMLGSTEGQSLPQVNGVQYEDKMGISGWIGEETILIGNRNLMQGHNITVPQASVDQKILKAGYFPVYIAVGGMPCLLFIVEYVADPAVAHELQSLCNTGMTVVIDPNDPNTVDSMICDYFGLPDDALKVMNHNGRVSYERTTAATESASAPAAFSTSVCGFFSAVTSAIRLNGIYAILTAVFIIASVLGLILAGYLLITGKASLINPLSVAVFQIVFAAISAIIAKLKS